MCSTKTHIRYWLRFMSGMTAVCCCTVGAFAQEEKPDRSRMEHPQMHTPPNENRMNTSTVILGIGDTIWVDDGYDVITSGHEMKRYRFKPKPVTEPGEIIQEK